MKLSDIFLEFFKLGCYAFGGPTAHVGYFRTRFVEQLKVIDDARFVELTALTQFLPGPGSSQLGMAVGHHLGGEKQGVWGSVMAFLGFTLPSMVLLIIAALTVRYGWVSADWLVGLKVLAIIVVFDALRGMIKGCCPTEPLKLIALGAAIIALTWQGVCGQLLIIVVTIGLALSPQVSRFVETSASTTETKRLSLPHVAKLFMATFIVGFVALPLLANLDDGFRLVDSFYRAGALVFGGGHVVLPLLGEDAFIQASMSEETFLAGYGLAQGVPGPMFTLASFLGTAVEGNAGGVLGGVLATLAIFLPGWLLLMAILPVWSQWRSHPTLQNVLTMISAATVGLLGAAFVSPVLMSGLVSPLAGALALALWALKTYLKLPIGALVVSAFVGGLFL